MPNQTAKSCVSGERFEVRLATCFYFVFDTVHLTPVSNSFDSQTAARTVADAMNQREHQHTESLIEQGRQEGRTASDEKVLSALRELVEAARRVVNDGYDNGDDKHTMRLLSGVAEKAQSLIDTLQSSTQNPATTPPSEGEQE